MAVPSIEAGLQRRVVQAQRQPYLFTEAEVEKLFEAARTFPSRKAPLRPTVLVAMLTLAYCAGLRVGEIAALTLGDVDLTDGTIEIRATKGFKSRRLPLAPGVLEGLSHYLGARAAAGAPTGPEAPLWWNTLRRHPYSYSVIDKLLRQVIRRAGLKPAQGKCGPRVHDLRHYSECRIIPSHERKHGKSRSRDEVELGIINDARKSQKRLPLCWKSR